MRAPRNPSRTNDQWSLDRLVQAVVGTPARRPAVSALRCVGSDEDLAEHTGTAWPTPTRSMESIPRIADRSRPPKDATYAREP